MEYPHFIEELNRRVLVFDGATGTSLQALGLSAVDFGGADLEGCNEHLVISRPEAVESVHRGFLEAGADVIETNTFGATSVVLEEYGIADLSREINAAAARIARRMAEDWSTADKPRFVAGSVGPTTKLPSLGHIDFDDLRDAYQEQMAGLIEGGVDILCIETCQDLLQTKAALAAARRCFEAIGQRLPVIVSVTIEATGSMLMGTDIGAAVAAMDPYDIVDVLGMNCATGPIEMEENLRALCGAFRGHVFAMPNAGIPENIGGRSCYRLTPDEMEEWMSRFVSEYGVRLIGGCCGTTPEHIARLAGIAGRVAPAERRPVAVPSAASTYTATPLRMDLPPLLVGERCNANGSKKFRALLLAGDYDGIAALAKEQEREGAHILDICVAYVGRNETRDMIETVRRLNTQATAPLMIDSTEAPVIEAALKRIAGRAIVNSINLESGEDRAGIVLRLCRDFGAAVIALTIDESGMARTAAGKLAIARRIRDLAVRKFGMRDEDLIFDPLTFTLGSGDEEYRRSAVETLDAIRLIKRELPRCFTSLGVSNVSFGLAPRARQALNSVFLHHAVEAGLDMAIVHAGRIMPLYKIDDAGRKLAVELISDERKWE